MKRIFPAVAILLFLSGCISSVYRGESFPATNTLQVYEFNEKAPANARVIGTGQASGEFSAVSNEDLREKLKSLGLQHGARFMVIIGTRIVPAEKIADSSNEDFLTATDDPDQFETENAMDTILDPPGSRQTYQRIMYAEFLR